MMGQKSSQNDANDYDDNYDDNENDQKFMWNRTGKLWRGLIPPFVNHDSLCWKLFI